MPVITPTGVKVQGNIKVSYVPTLASQSAPTATEVNAAGSLDISCYLSSEGWAPSIDNAKGSAPRRLCSKVIYEQFGNTTYSLGDLMYVYNPQGVALSNDMKAYEKLLPDAAGFFVVRLGSDAISVDFAATQFVEVWPVRLGQRLPVFDPADEFAEFMIQQAVIVTGARTERVALT
jgi:hypothetical protein